MSARDSRFAIRGSQLAAGGAGNWQLATGNWRLATNNRMPPHDLTSAPATDPVGLYRMRDGLYAADMLLTALVHLDLFSWMNTHPATRAEICRAFEIVDRPADVMLTVLAAMGLVEERDGVWHLTTLAREHLVSDSPWFLGPYYAPLKERPVSLDLLKVLRTG